MRAVTDTERCKCCGETAPLFGATDFNKNCEQAKTGAHFESSGIPIYYHRCSNCGLLFTTAFDDFSKEQFAEHIYNADYHLADPEYAEARPLRNTKLLCTLFGQNRGISILDYGGGAGTLARMLKLSGFGNVVTYDPFVAVNSALPQRQFQLILAYEVVEHSPTPMETFSELVSRRAEDGIVLFSTLTQPANIDQVGINWWYASPRNGHVTLFSMKSLELMAKRLQCRFKSFGPGMHALYTRVPDFARQLLGPR